MPCSGAVAVARRRALGLPWTGAPPARHRGQGSATFPVMYVVEVRATFSIEVPPTSSSVPLAGADHVFTTQVVRLLRIVFGISSGVPKLQPVVAAVGVGAVRAAGAT